MIARGKCSECGANFQTDSEPNLEKLIADHVSAQHSSIEQRHEKVLNDCLSAFFTVATGAKLSQGDARDLYNRVADLQGKPKLSVRGPEPEPEPVQPEQLDPSRNEPKQEQLT